jgi:hypothetical protein
MGPRFNWMHGYCRAERVSMPGAEQSTRRRSVAMIGQSDQANHQYDVSDFWEAANAGNLPA